jgi:hypothetical protein
VRYRPQRADIVVAVNRAATAHWCDVLSALDWPLVRSIAGEVIGRPRWLTSADSAGLSNGGRPFVWGGVSLIDDMLGWCPMPGWTVYSAPMALVYCAKRGAKVIDCYGVDMVGTKDWDGRDQPTGRDDRRWQREAIIWRGVVEWLSGMGVTVTRHNVD